MLWRMRSRVFAVSLGAASLLGFAACGSSGGGTGASPATTIKLGAASYQTLVPATSTIPPTTLPGDPGAVVANEQAYTIKSGDYLYGIAKSFCSKAQDIADYNGWTEGVTHKLVPGVSIKIPPNGCAPGTVTAVTNAPIVTTVATAVATTTTFDASTGGSYKVVAGDYLGGIAKKTGATVDGIVAANGWADGAGHVIIPGQTIKLPAKTG